MKRGKIKTRKNLKIARLRERSMGLETKMGAAFKKRVIGVQKQGGKKHSRKRKRKMQERRR